MTSIVKATKNDAHILSEIAKITFIESHGSSASEDDINFYISRNYTTDIFETALLNPKNIYYLIYHNETIAGFSNIILNAPYTNSETENIAKLERLYLLKDFYNLKLGRELFEFNLRLAKQDNQQGIWLFVWIENQRAINFYRKNGFTIIGKHDFKISETHTNPNHQMFLKL